MKKDDKRVTMQLRMDKAMLDSLTESAKAKGIDRSSLVKMWIFLKLQEEKKE